jgi:hypothetical protein
MVRHRNAPMTILVTYKRFARAKMLSLGDYR